MQKGKNSVEDGIFEVVGFDVAGDEGRFPLQSFSDPMAEGMKRYLEKSQKLTVQPLDFFCNFINLSSSFYIF